jgi:translation initiation factor eIF-2B subunit delta
MTAADIAGLIDQLAEDHTSGAAELAGKASRVLVLLAEQTEADDLTSFLSEVGVTGKKLCHAQPSMAPLFNLANSVGWSLEGVLDLEGARRRVRGAAQSFASELQSGSERIADRTLSLITDGATVLTHSRSSTVLAALLLARGRGQDFRVISTESRPLYEGRTLAQELSSEGVATTLVTDAAVTRFLGQADLVLVGADSLSRDGLVNKTGTRGVALAARASGVPFYALCGTEKFLPAGYPFFEIENKDPEEVWPGFPPGVTVLNPYFDVTPLENVTAVVTEDGILSRLEVENRLSQLRVHHTLLDP